MRAFRHVVRVGLLGVALSQIGACGGSGGSGPLVPGRLSIPAAAFLPPNGTDTYEQAGAYLLRIGENPGSPDSLPFAGNCFAPVHLPDGATPTRFTMKFRDGSAGFVSARFLRSRFVTGPYGQVLATVSSFDSFANGNAGEVSTTAFAFSQLATDNQRWMYWINVYCAQPAIVSTAGIPAVSAIEIDYLTHETPPPTRYHGLPAAAFGAFSSSQTWNDTGEFLLNQTGFPDPDGWGTYVAPVLLPDGASVESLTFAWRVSSSSPTPDPSALATVRLYRASHQDSSSEQLAEATSQAIEGEGQVTVAPASEVVVDNATYAYWISASLPSWLVDFVFLRSVVLSYAAPASATDRVALPAAAFHPSDPSLVFENHGRYLVHQGFQGTPPSPGQNGRYYAALELPDGATISGMTFFWDADTDLAGIARLERTQLSNATLETMATASTGTGTLGNGSTSTTAISNAVVDNAQYAYWVSWDLPNYQPVYPQAVRGHSVVVEYTK